MFLKVSYSCILIVQFCTFQVCNAFFNIFHCLYIVKYILLVVAISSIFSGSSLTVFSSLIANPAALKSDGEVCSYFVKPLHSYELSEVHQH